MVNLLPKGYNKDAKSETAEAGFDYADNYPDPAHDGPPRMLRGVKPLEITQPLVPEPSVEAGPANPELAVAHTETVGRNGHDVVALRTAALAAGERIEL